jgi:hypothetical protein
MAALWAPRRAAAQRGFAIRPERLDAPPLAFVLLWGAPVDLERLPGGRSQPLQVRLWQVAVERSCGPAGHLICAYRYYLAVGDPGEGGAEAVYDLGEFGTVERLRWLSGASDERPVLELTALNYPAHVFRYWPGLRRERRTFVLTADTDSVRVRARNP